MYRKKQAEILVEAMQVTNDVVKDIEKQIEKDPNDQTIRARRGRLSVATPAGRKDARAGVVTPKTGTANAGDKRLGDWLIKHEDNTLDVMSAKAFEAAFEAVGEPDSE